MADKNPKAAAPTATATAPSAPATPPKADEGKNGEGNGGKKGRGPKPQEVFPTADAAIEAAKSRDKGPRRAFKCTAPNGAEIFVVAHNEGRAGGIAFTQITGKVEELGGKARATKAVGVDGIMAAVNALPEAERTAVLAQLKALTGGK
jgi:hypothetical protein